MSLLKHSLPTIFNIVLLKYEHELHLFKLQMYNYLKCVPSIFLIPIQIYFHKPSKNRSYAQIRTLVLSLSFVRVNSWTLAHVSNVFGFSEYHYNCIWYCIAIQMKREGINQIPSSCLLSISTKTISGPIWRFMVVHELVL